MLHFRGSLFQFLGSLFHVLTLVYSSTHGVREFIYRHVVLHLLVLSLRCDIEYYRLEKAIGSQSRTEQRHSEKLSLLLW
jgi:hypothetical protein